MKKLFISSMDDRTDRVLRRIEPLLTGCKYPLKIRYSGSESWENVSTGAAAKGDGRFAEEEIDETMLGRGGLLSAVEGRDMPRIFSRNAHQVSDREVIILDSLSEDMGSGDMLITFMDMDRYRGHNPGGYLSQRASSAGAFSLGMVFRSRPLPDFNILEELNRQLLALTTSFNGLVAVPREVLIKGRNIDIAHLIRNLSDMAFTPGIVNLDNADLMLTSRGGSILVMTWGAAKPGGNKAVTSVRDALSRPLCALDLRSVRKAMVNVVGSGDLTLEDSLVAAEYLRRRVRPDAHIIWGVSIVDDMENEMEVLLILATTPMELLMHWYSTE